MPFLPETRIIERPEPAWHALARLFLLGTFTVALSLNWGGLKETAPVQALTVTTTQFLGDFGFVEMGDVLVKERAPSDMQHKAVQYNSIGKPYAVGKTTEVHYVR